MVRKLDGLGGLVDKLVSLGANRFDGIQFEVSGFEKKKDEARRDAMKNALRMAKLYAEASGAVAGGTCSRFPKAQGRLVGRSC